MVDTIGIELLPSADMGNCQSRHLSIARQSANFLCFFLKDLVEGRPLCEQIVVRNNSRKLVLCDFKNYHMSDTSHSEVSRRQVVPMSGCSYCNFPGSQGCMGNTYVLTVW